MKTPGEARASPSVFSKQGFANGTLDGHAIQWNNKLNAWNLLGMEFRVVGNEQIYSHRSRARELDRSGSAQRAVCPQSRVSQSSMLLERNHHRRRRNQFLVVGDCLRVMILKWLYENFAKRDRGGQ